MQESLKIKPKESHLNPGEKRIIVCLVESKLAAISPHDKQLFLEDVELDHSQAQNVKLNEDNIKLKNEGYTVGDKKYSYVISPISESDKFSEEYLSCTGLVVSGRDKQNGKYISFLTHQNPAFFLNSAKEEFHEALQSNLREMKKRCEAGTIDAVGFGGIYKYTDSTDSLSEDYIDSKNFITEIVNLELGFKPEFVNGPKPKNNEATNKDFFFFNNAARKAYLVRPEINTNIL